MTRHVLPCQPGLLTVPFVFGETDRMLDLARVSSICETGSYPLYHPGSCRRLSEEKSSGVRGYQTNIELGLDSAPTKALESELRCVTLCLHRVGLLIRHR